jgi:hypothetical protein
LGIDIKCEGCEEIEEMERLARSNVLLPEDALTQPCTCASDGGGLKNCLDKNKCPSCQNFDELNALSAEENPTSAPDEDPIRILELAEEALAQPRTPTCSVSEGSRLKGCPDDGNEKCPFFGSKNVDELHAKFDELEMLVDLHVNFDKFHATSSEESPASAPDENPIRKPEEVQTGDASTSEKDYKDAMAMAVWDKISRAKKIQGHLWRSFIMQNAFPSPKLKIGFKKKAIRAAKEWKGAKNYANGSDFDDMMDFLWYEEYIAAMVSVMKEALMKDGFETINEQIMSWEPVIIAITTELNKYRVATFLPKLGQRLKPWHKKTISAHMSLLIHREWPDFVKHVQNITEEYYYASPTGTPRWDYQDHVRSTLGFDTLQSRIYKIIDMHCRELEAVDEGNEGSTNVLAYKEKNKLAEPKLAEAKRKHYLGL